MSAEVDGVNIAALTKGALARLGLPADTQGVIVSAVDPGSAAADKLRTGDIIDKINHQAVTSPAEYTELAQGLLGGEPALLSDTRNQTKMFVVVNPS